MAYALVLATALILALTAYQQIHRNKVWKWLIVGLVIGLTLYAGLLRYNALIAVIPILYLAIDRLGVLRSWRVKLLLGVGLVVFATGMSMIGNKMLNVVKMNPTSAVMLDDIINIRTKEELAKRQGNMYEALISIQHKCGARRTSINSYWLCTEENQRKIISQDHYDELKGYWFTTILSDPFAYALYRVETFTIFIFAPDQYVFRYQKGVVPNSLGQKVRYEKVQNILHIYVMEFGYRHFSYLFQAWFWIIAGFVTLWIGAKKLRRYSKEVIVLSASSLIYIFSYLPMVVAADYRYIYWSVFATLIALLLIVIEKLSPSGRTKRRHVKNSKPLQHLRERQ